LSASNEYVGYNYWGTFSQSSGTNTVSNLLLGDFAVIGPLPASNGTYNLSGGLLAISQIVVGSGSGVLNFTGGTIGATSAASISAPIVLSSPADTGTINTNGYTMTISGTISGPGNLNKVGAGTLVISGNDMATGSFQASAGTLQFNGGYEVLGSGSIRAQAGAVVQYANAAISGGFLRGPGTHTTLPGTSNFFSGVTTYTSTNFLQNGSDTFTNFTNGGQVTNNAPLVWDGGVNSGGANLVVNSTLSSDDFSNAGTITINNGGVLNNHLSDMTSYGGGQITVNSGGTLNADSQSEGVALDLQDSLLVNNGVVAGTTNVNYNATVTGSGSFGPINVNYGGTLAMAVTANSTPLSLSVSSGSIVGAGQLLAPVSIAEATLDTPDSTDVLTSSGDISGAGPLTKTGAGLLILSGDNSYNGGTDVVGGTLEIASSAALPEGSSLTIGAGGASPFDLAAAQVAAVNGQTFAGSPGAAVAAVPEPGTLTLVGLAGIVAAGVPWRRRRKRCEARAGMREKGKWEKGK
jgi:autotransporter-associated beta strand protein